MTRDPGVGLEEQSNSRRLAAWPVIGLILLLPLVLGGCGGNPQATVTAQAEALVAAVEATLTAQPTSTTTEVPMDTATPDLAATEAAEVELVAEAMAATLAAQPTSTATEVPADTPTPHLAATKEAEAGLVAKGMAATLTAQPTSTVREVPTDTPVPTSTVTPDAGATEAAEVEMIAAALEATLMAQPTAIPTNTPLPKKTPMPTVDLTATGEAASSELALAVEATLTAQPTPTLNLTYYENRYLGVTLEFPWNWSYVDLGQEPPVVAFGWVWYGMRGLVDGAVLVVGTDDEFVGMDIDELINDVQQELEVDGMKLEITGPRTIDDNVANGIALDLVVPESEDFLAGQRIYGKMYVFDRKGVGYIVAALSADEDSWKEHEPIFEQVIDSIVLSDPITPTPTPTWTATNTSTVTPTPLPTDTPAATATPKAIPTRTPTDAPEFTATSLPTTTPTAKKPMTAATSAPSAPPSTPAPATTDTQVDAVTEASGAPLGFTSEEGDATPALDTSEPATTAMTTLDLKEWGMSLPYPKGWTEVDRTDSSAFIVEDPAMLEVPESELRGGAIIVFTEDESQISPGTSMKKVFVQAVDGEFHVDTLDPDDVKEAAFGNKQGYEARFEIEEDEDMHAKFWGKLTTSQSELILVVAVSLRADEWETYEPLFVQMFDGATFSD